MIFSRLSKGCVVHITHRNGDNYTITIKNIENVRGTDRYYYNFRKNGSDSEVGGYYSLPQMESFVRDGYWFVKKIENMDHFMDCDRLPEGLFSL